jgi:hypothetical protein
MPTLAPARTKKTPKAKRPREDSLLAREKSFVVMTGITN